MQSEHIGAQIGLRVSCGFAVVRNCLANWICYTPQRFAAQLHVARIAQLCVCGGGGSNSTARSGGSCGMIMRSSETQFG